jgi:peptidoglycan/LPS O-acetylase OafA/YrhL
MVLAAYERHLIPLLLPLIEHVFYVHNFYGLRPISFVTWSLEVEVQFYILAPVLGLLYAISSPVVRRSVIVSLIAASTAFQYLSHGTASWNLPGQLQFFLVGFLLADLRATRTESTTSRWWDLVSLVVWVAIFALPTACTSLCLPLLILLAYLATFNGPVSRQIFRTLWIALTGGMCYSFYLMHMLVISTAFRFTRRLLIPSNLPLSFLIQATLLGACIYLVCTAYFVLVERPCMDPKWPHKLRMWLAQLSSPAHLAAAETNIENS